MGNPPTYKVPFGLELSPHFCNMVSELGEENNSIELLQQTEVHSGLSVFDFLSNLRPKFILVDPSLIYFDLR
jgi:hypothetical protein